MRMTGERKRKGEMGVGNRTAKDAGADDEDGRWWGVGRGVAGHYVDERVSGEKIHT